MRPTAIPSAALLLLAACGPEAAPASGGARLYQVQGCATCHGSAGEGALTGPPLAGSSARWKREDLAAFLADPESFVARDPRLAQQKKKFMMPMQAFAHLSKEERLELADHVLSLR